MVLQGSYKFSPATPESVTHWDIYYESGYGTDVIGNAESHTGYIEDNFCRASKQYDSPLLNSKQGCGWKILEYASSSEDTSTAQVLKVYKPMGAYKIVIHGKYTLITEEGPVSRDTEVEMDFSHNRYLKYTSTVVTISLGSQDSLPEIYEHISEASTSSISLFKERSHELQINGSNFGVSQHDYMSPVKHLVNKLNIRAIPDYSNFSMTRTFQKFYIGGYRKS